MDGPSESVVELEIYAEWYWWAGYPRDSRYMTCRLAKIHGPEFSTWNTFPTRKPDIDVFGVPCRSRRQRGWHQVAVPFLGRPSERPGKRAHFQDPAKPSDIPPELFDNILHHLKDWDNTRDRREMRSTLARCALVCRYWSWRCQESLLGDLGLDAREHALQLLKFMRTPISATPSFVYYINVGEVQAVSGTPWLHFISVIGDRAHQELREYYVGLKGPLPAGQRMRSIHRGLPRSLPSHFSRRITQLLLTDIHFKELNDFMHLIWEMPHLNKLKCERVTWGSLPTALPRRKPRNESELKKCIEMSECGPRPVESSFWLAASVHRRDAGFFSPDDFAHVVPLARGLENGASTSVSTFFGSDYFIIDLGQDLRFCYYGSGWDSHPSSQQWCIDTAVIDVRKFQDAELAENSRLDWKVMDEAVSSFLGMKRMVVGLDSREDMVHFEQAVAMVHMPLLSGSGMLKYALWDPSGIRRDGGKGTWLRASPDSDDTEVSGCFKWELRKVFK